MNEKELEIKASRENEIYEKTFQFFEESCMNLITPVGDTGSFDMAFNINRKEIIIKSMKDLINKMEQT